MALTKAKLMELIAIGAIAADLNIKDYGAIGDGATVDNDAITAAIAAVPSGGTLEFEPNKTYLISSPVTLDKPINVKLNGSTILCNGAVNTDDAIIITSDGVTVRNGTIDLNYCVDNGIFANGRNDLKFIGLKITKSPIDATNENKSIRIIGGEYIRIRDCRFIDNWNSEIGADFRAGGVMLDSCKYCWIDNPYFNHCGNGLNLYQCQNVFVKHVYMYDINDNGFYIQDASGASDPAICTQNIHLSNIHIDGVGEGLVFSVYRNIDVNGTSANVKVIGVEMRNVRTRGISLRKGSGLQIIGASFVDCDQAVGKSTTDSYCTDILVDGIHVLNAPDGPPIELYYVKRATIKSLYILGALASNATRDGVRLVYSKDSLIDNAVIIGDGANLRNGIRMTSCENIITRVTKITGTTSSGIARYTSTGVIAESNFANNNSSYSADGVTQMILFADGTATIKLPTSSADVPSGGLWNNGGTLAIKA